jgi:hypothetical protein
MIGTLDLVLDTDMDTDKEKEIETEQGMVLDGKEAMKVEKAMQSGMEMEMEVALDGQGYGNNTRYGN